MCIFFFLFFSRIGSPGKSRVIFADARDALKNNAAGVLALRHRACPPNSNGIRRNRAFPLPDIRLTTAPRHDSTRANNNTLNPRAKCITECTQRGSSRLRPRHCLGGNSRPKSTGRFRDPCLPRLNLSRSASRSRRGFPRSDARVAIILADLSRSISFAAASILRRPEILSRECRE